MFLWQFLLPLIIFVVVYWKILGIIRRQAKITAERNNISLPAGTNSSSSRNENQRVGGMEFGPGGDSVVVGDYGVSRTLSNAQINVVRTMVYISVCFILCWMPMYFNVLFKRITVRQSVGLSADI